MIRNSLRFSDSNRFNVYPKGDDECSKPAQYANVFSNTGPAALSATSNSACVNLDDFQPGSFSDRVYQQNLYSDVNITEVLSPLIPNQQFVIIKVYFGAGCKNGTATGADIIPYGTCVQANSASVPGAYFKINCPDGLCKLGTYNDAACKEERDRQPDVYSVEGVCSYSETNQWYYKITRVLTNAQGILSRYLNDRPILIDEVLDISLNFVLQDRTVYINTTDSINNCQGEIFKREKNAFLGGCPTGYEPDVCYDRIPWERSTALNDNVVSQYRCNEADSFPSLQDLLTAVAPPAPGVTDYFRVRLFFGNGCIAPQTLIDSAINSKFVMTNKEKVPCVDSSKVYTNGTGFVQEFYDDEKCAKKSVETRFAPYDYFGVCLDTNFGYSFIVERIQENPSCNKVVINLNTNYLNIQS
jgi:hypothetical protein